jgi:hypothetical protein
MRGERDVRGPFVDEFVLEDERVVAECKEPISNRQSTDPLDRLGYERIIKHGFELIGVKGRGGR